MIVKASHDRGKACVLLSKKLIESGKIPKKTIEIIGDMTKKALIYNGLSVAQCEFIEGIYEKVFTVNQPSQVNTVKDPQCRICSTNQLGRDEIGIVNVIYQGAKTLVRCSCWYGSRERWRLPFLSDIEVESHSPLDNRLFIPSNGLKSIDDKVAWWRETVKIAEDFWSHNGYVYIARNPKYTPQITQ
jgi:hypothetical protein